MHLRCQWCCRYANYINWDVLLIISNAWFYPFIRLYTQAMVSSQRVLILLNFVRLKGSYLLVLQHQPSETWVTKGIVVQHFKYCNLLLYCQAIMILHAQLYYWYRDHKQCIKEDHGCGRCTSRAWLSWWQPRHQLLKIRSWKDWISYFDKTHTWGWGEGLLFDNFLHAAMFALHIMLTIYVCYLTNTVIRHMCCFW